MKRFHIHVSVKDLSESISFYSKLFASEPSVTQDDYAKWMLDDPRINFAISRRGHVAGVNHVGFQVDSDIELAMLRTRVAQAKISALDEKGANCCYARSDKYWVEDPQGIAWETFHSLQEIPLYGDDAVLKPGAEGACCVPNKEQSPEAAEACCVPSAKNELEKTDCCR